MLFRSFLFCIVVSTCLPTGRANDPAFEHTETGVLRQEDPSEYAETLESSVRRFLSLSTADANVLLKDHNDFRSTTAQGNTPNQPSATNMNQLLWDPALATVAANYANKCLWDHNANRNSDYSAISSRLSTSGVGENLAMTFRCSSTSCSAPASQFAVAPGYSLASLQSGIKGWYDEYTQYTFNTHSCSGVCGHYTAMVWHNTRYVGCGYSHCATATDPANGKIYYGARILVCNYSPPGNYVGQKPYTSGTSCSACPSSLTSCSLGLCGASGSGGGGGTGSTSSTTSSTSTSTTSSTTTPSVTSTTSLSLASGDGSCNAGLTGTIGFYFKVSNAVCADYANALVAFKPCVGQVVSCDDIPYPGFSAYRKVTIAWQLDMPNWNLGFTAWRSGIQAQLAANPAIVFAGASSTGQTPPATQGTIQSSSSSTSNSPASENKTPIIIGAVFGALAVCCIAGFCFWFAQRQKKLNSEEYKMMEEQQAGVYHPPTAPIIS